MIGRYGLMDLRLFFYYHCSPNSVPSHRRPTTQNMPKKEAEFYLLKVSNKGTTHEGRDISLRTLLLYSVLYHYYLQCTHINLRHGMSAPILFIYQSTVFCC